jgi:diphthamide biosynthesis protein 4
MENKYDILESDVSDSYDVLKKSYQRLILKYHPDKLDRKSMTAEDISECENRFITINDAWRTLSDPVQRKSYDAVWTQRCLLQNWPIQDDVQIEDFESCDDTNGQYFEYECRCGGSYILTEAQVSFGVDLVCCDTCTLSIRILYPEESER